MLVTLLISCIATCLVTPHALPVTSLYCKSLKQRYSTASMAKWSRCPARMQRVGDSIPGGDIYFLLNFSFLASLPSLQVGGALAIEIKYDHSPAVIAVLVFAASQQRTLTPPDTWSCPTFGLASVLMLRPISPRTCRVSGLWVSNIRYSLLLFCLDPRHD